MRSRLVSFLLTLSLLSTSAMASAHPAQEVVKDTADKVLERLNADKEELRKNPEKIYALVHELIIPHFEEFQTLLVRTYATALLEYSNEDIVYAPVNEKPESNLVTVKTEVKQSGSQSIPINYTMHVTDGEWKVVDVSVNGASLVSTYRGSFASEVRRGSMETLLSKLAERNAKSNAATTADLGSE